MNDLGENHKHMSNRTAKLHPRRPGLASAQLVPTEIAVCPECGGPIKWWCPDDIWCFCEGSNHAPEQSAAMLERWDAVEATVKAWLAGRGSTIKSTGGAE